MVDTLNAANASMTEFVDGTEKLRNPIDILRDLAKTFNQLDEDDPLRAEILTNVGQKYHAAKLGALLQNMDMFDKMLVDYSNGAGSALREADLSANDLTGTLNKLSNSWDALVNSITSKSTIKGGVSFLDTLLQSATKLIDTVDVLPVALAGVTGFLTAKNKDYGISKVFDTTAEGKLPHLDLEGNLFGIDFSQIKYFKEASGAIEKWNAYVKAGKIDINDFNSEVVKNNASLRNYLSTCTDSSASLKGYKQSLQAAGVATNSLRLGTILLNTALSFGLGIAIQGVISGLDYLINKQEREAEVLENAKSAAENYKNALTGIREETKKTASSANDIAAAYARLAQGVNTDTNKNIHLSNEDYQRFLDLNSQLADLFPSLTKGYDENGNAILGLGGSVETVTEKIAALVEMQERLARSKIKESLQKYVEGDDENYGQLKVIEEKKEALDSSKKDKVLYEMAYDRVVNGIKGEVHHSEVKLLDKLLEEAGLENGKDYKKQAISSLYSQVFFPLK